MEEICCLVPVDPHTAEVVTKEVVQRVPGEETQAVRNPVCLIWVVVEIRLNTPSQITDRFRSFLISTRPDAQSDSIKGVGRVLLQDKRVMNTVGLAPAGANLNIVREASL